MRRLIGDTFSYHLNSARAALTGLPLWVWPVPVVLALAVLGFIQWLILRKIQGLV